MWFFIVQWIPKIDSSQEKKKSIVSKAYFDVQQYILPESH